MKQRSTKISAGILLFRKSPAPLQVFLAYPGGPFFKNKDEGVWTIPKGEVNPSEDYLQTALREFKEETGITLDPKKKFITLGNITQKSGKVVHAWAVEGNIPLDFKITSGRCQIEWPPRSGKIIEIPEIDRAEFFTIAEAQEKIIETQRAFLERLVQSLE